MAMSKEKFDASFSARLARAFMDDEPQTVASLYSEAMSSITKDVLAVMSAHSYDKPFVLAALRICAAAMESIMPDVEKELADEIVKKSEIVTATVKIPPGFREEGGEQDEC